VKHGLVKAGDDRNCYALRDVGVVEIDSEWTTRDRETKTSGHLKECSLSQSLP
jgi:hypothetical protein